MNKTRKEYIDSLWQNTLYGKCVRLGMEGEKDEYAKMVANISSKYPFSVGEAGIILANQVNSKIQKGEFIDYLKYLENEEPKLLNYLYANTSFYDEMMKIN